MAITAKQYNNDLKEIPAEKTKPCQQPGWITELEYRINSLRRKIGQLETVIKYENKGCFTRHQKQLQKKFRKMFHTKKTKVFEYHLNLLKQDLKATSEKRRYENKLLQRKRIKNQFNRNRKSVYRLFRGNNTTIRNLPNQNDVETLWRKIWGESTEFNYNAL